MEGLDLAGGWAKMARKCLHIDVVLSISDLSLVIQHCLSDLQNILNNRVLEVSRLLHLRRTDL